jgi:hypothetical protein
MTDSLFTLLGSLTASIRDSRRPTLAPDRQPWIPAGL